MSRRRKRRSKSEARKKRGAVWFTAVAFIMLLVLMVLLVPRMRRNNISREHAIELVLLMWACSVLAAWVCVRATKKHRRESSGQFSTYTDYSDVVHHDSETR